MPAGGLSADRMRWIKPRYAFFLPVKVLSFYGDLRLLAQPKTLAAWLRPLFRKD
jgi:hypothetical protein